MSGDWRADVCEFWFGLTYAQWFAADLTLDDLIRQRFLALWTDKRQLPVDGFTSEALEALAATVLFDQFPRNMFRGNAEQFATDHLALQIAKAAVDKGFDEQLAATQRAFLYMPFEHSEDIADQNRSIILFTALGDGRYLRYAKLHHDIIERFGRFPHRNAVLGRPSRSQEVAAGDVVPW